MTRREVTEARQLSDLKWPDVGALGKDTPIVLPVAALEQHGRHLPVFTDSMILAEVVRRAAERVGDRAVFAPLLWLGNSDHHLDFPGTLSAPPRAYIDVLVGLMENLIAHGFRRIVFVNGHGGNDVPGRQAIFETRQRHRERRDLLLLFGTYWTLVQSLPGGLHQKSMGHACEWETSMILRIAPGLVGEWKGIAPVAQGDAFEPAARGWTTKDRSEPGHIGSPHLASAEKGEALLDAFAGGVAAFLERVSRWDGKSWA
jgi:creatinine amidohydrolase